LTIIKCFRVKPHLSDSTTKNALIFLHGFPNLSSKLMEIDADWNHLILDLLLYIFKCNYPKFCIVQIFLKLVLNVYYKEEL